MKCSSFQAVVVSILLYGCTTWTLTKRLEKNLDGNYTRMLRAILNKSWRQYPIKHQLYDHLPSITKTIQVRRTRHAGHCWRSRDELISDVLLWTPHMAEKKQNGQLEYTYGSYVRIRGVAQRRWTIGRSGKRGSRISVLVARHYDDETFHTGNSTWNLRLTGEFFYDYSNSPLIDKVWYKVIRDEQKPYLHRPREQLRMFKWDFR